MGADGDEDTMKPTNEPITLTYDSGMRLLPIGYGLAFTALMILILVGFRPEPAGQGEGLWVLLFLVAVTIGLPWLLFVEFFGRMVTIEDAGISVKSGCRRRARFLKWADIESVSIAGGGIRLIRSGKRLTIPTGLQGEDLFWSIVRENVTAQRLDKKTIDYLHTRETRRQIRQGD